MNIRNKLNSLENAIFFKWNVVFVIAIIILVQFWTNSKIFSINKSINLQRKLVFELMEKVDRINKRESDYHMDVLEDQSLSEEAKKALLSLQTPSASIFENLLVYEKNRLIDLHTKRDLYLFLLALEFVCVLGIVILGVDRRKRMHTKLCLYCSETIRKDASVCRYCGREQSNVKL